MAIIPWGTHRCDYLVAPESATAKCALNKDTTVGANIEIAVRPNERQRLAGSAMVDRAHDVDAGDDRAEVIGRPANETKDAAWRE